ncbi:hypothetical protein [Shewanella sp. YLB-07]|nr:hypothetical protein [Shewanella sp. YLB-07]
MKNLFYLIALLLSVNASATSNGHPPDYPDDAEYKAPTPTSLKTL